MLGAVFHIKEICGENAVVSYRQKVNSANICNITVTFESRTCAESKIRLPKIQTKVTPDTRTTTVISLWNRHRMPKKKLMCFKIWKNFS